MVIYKTCLTFLLHLLGTSGSQEGRPMRPSPLSRHISGAYERKTDPRARWTSLVPALCIYWLSVDGAGRVSSFFGTNVNADASVTKLPWMAFKRIPLSSKLCCLENQLVKVGWAPAFPGHSACSLRGELDSFRYSWCVLMPYFLSHSIHHCSAS